MDDLNLTDNPTMGSIIKLCSNDAGDKLSYDFGGRRMYIPHKVGVHHPLAVSIGLDNAKKICDAWGGLDFDVPLCAGKIKLAVELKEEKNLSNSKIASQLKCTERHVYRIFQKIRQDADQLNLF